jgi:16S rRNA (cytidine1402-2'-O)-methyltransferase
MKKELSACAELGKTIAFYESPRRILKTVEICLEVFGENARMCLAREITKKFEEHIRGSVKAVLAEISARKEMLGEFVILIYPNLERVKSEE